jgi:hypothetical protein
MDFEICKLKLQIFCLKIWWNNLLKECEVDDESKPSSIQWWIRLAQLQPFIKVVIVKISKNEKRNEWILFLVTYTHNSIKSLEEILSIPKYGYNYSCD